ncbi:MAG: EI24 domain-containing protein [Azonexus sp.]|nr:EI24 domain-containing protein [Azonexus sp.]MDP3635998.1 EI24 domain-containing protein [Azonexus sp.]MDZ4316981.1 EI24 domain-containing protein [Azonexus sp.]
MADVVLALMRSFASLRQGRIWLYVLVPALFSLVLWVVLAIWGLGLLIEWLLGHPPMTILIGWGLAWLATVLAYTGAWMAIFAGAYLTTSLLAAIVIMPLILKQLAETDYQDVAPMGKDSFTAAAVNSIFASILFIAGWLLTLPLWIIPGLSLILPLLLMAWLNRRTFAYDALSMHATDVEWQSLRGQHKGPMFMLGLSMALLAHIPVIGLLVPALAALAFVHYGLETLRRSRGGALLTGEARRVVE